VLFLRAAIVIPPTRRRRGAAAAILCTRGKPGQRKLCSNRTASCC
jgi:hypothetical protein